MALAVARRETTSLLLFRCRVRMLVECGRYFSGKVLISPTAFVSRSGLDGGD